MQLERNRNVDGNEPRVTGRTLYTAPGEERVVAMGIANAEAIYSMLSDLSANKGAYVLREAYSNAHDATMRSGDMGRPIEICLTDAHADGGENLVMKLSSRAGVTRMLSVTDHGTGMSADEIAANFLQYGGSDKRDEADSVGSKGLGSKAPLAVTESFVVTSTKDSLTTTAIVERTPKQAGRGRLTTERTGAESGTTVQIPVPDKQTFMQMQTFLRTLVAYNTDANLIVNGRPAKRMLPERHGTFDRPYLYVGKADVGDRGQCPVRIWEANDPKKPFSSGHWPLMCDSIAYVDLVVVIGGVPYSLDGKHVYANDAGMPTACVVVELQPGWLDFTPSRDEVKQNDATEQMRRDLQTALADIDYTNDLSDLLSHDTEALVRFVATSRIDARGTGCSSYPHVPDYRTSFWVRHESDDAVTVRRFDYRHRLRVNDKVRGATLDAASLGGGHDGEARMNLVTRMTQSNAHLLATEPMSANQSAGDVKRVMDLNGSHVVKGRISKASLTHCKTPDAMLSLVTDALDELPSIKCAVVVTGIRDDDDLRRMMRAENDYRLSRPQTQAQTSHAVYVLCDEKANLGEELLWLVGDLGVEVVSLPDVESTARKVRSARNRRRRRERAEMLEGGTRNPLPGIQDRWMAVNVPVVSLSDTHTVTWYLAAAERSSWGYNSSTPRMGYDIRSLRGFVVDEEDGMASVALLATSCDEIGARKEAQKWAARISALRLRKSCPVDDRVRYVIGLAKGTSTGLIRGLVARGATLIYDDRDNVKTPIEDTLVNRNPGLVDILGRMDARTMFDDDDPEPCIWAVLSDDLAHIVFADRIEAEGLDSIRMKQMHRLNVATARLAYDLLADEALDDDVVETVMRPLETLFSKRDADPSDTNRPYPYRGQGSAHYRVEYEKDYHIIIPGTDYCAPKLRNLPELAMRMELAVQLASDAARFMLVPWITDRNNPEIDYLAFPDSDAIASIRPVVGSVVARNLEDAVRTLREATAA